MPWNTHVNGQAAQRTTTSLSNALARTHAARLLSEGRPTVIVNSHFTRVRRQIGDGRLHAVVVNYEIRAVREPSVSGTPLSSARELAATRFGGLHGGRSDHLNGRDRARAARVVPPNVQFPP